MTVKTASQMFYRVTINGLKFRNSVLSIDNMNNVSGQTRGERRMWSDV